MWENWKDKLPASHVWSCSFAIRRKEKRRAIGGLIIGIKKDWADKEWEVIKREEGNIGMLRIKDQNRITNIVLVYNREKNGKELGEILYKITEEYKKDRLIVGGDMNIRIGELGSDEEEGGLIRKSKDKIINKEGKLLVERLQESGLNVLNGRSVGDGEGEYTYVGARGSTVIDYVFANDVIIDNIIDFRIDVRVDSDHMPLCVEMEEEEEEKKEERRRDGRKELGKREEVEWRKYICWTEETRELYKDRTEEKGWKEGPEEMPVDLKWENLRSLIMDSMVHRKKKQLKRKLGYKDWWDKLCTIKKRKAKKVYMKWKKGLVTREVYVEKRKELKNICEKKRKEKREEERRILKSLKNEAEIWDFINRRRRKKVRKEAKVAQEDWRKYFMELLGGEEEARTEKEGVPGSWSVLVGSGEQEERGAKMERLAEEDIMEAVKRMRLKKAASIDGIPMEA